MSKKLELSRFEAMRRLLLFIKLRKGKTITDETIKNFDKLINKMYDNFKNNNYNTISNIVENDYKSQRIALKSIKSGFISFEKGGHYKISDINQFAFYKDEKHRIKIKDEQIEITEFDYKVLYYIFLD